MSTRHRALDLLVVAVFIVSLTCFLAALWKANEDTNPTIEIAVEANRNELDYMYELDKDIVYTDKADYRMAIGYQDTIFQDGPTEKDVDETPTPLPRQEQIKHTQIEDEVKLKNEGKNQTYSNTTYSASSDDEENIDQNPVAEKYRDEINGKVRRLQCSQDNPLKSIVFLKTHRTGSSTLGNILQRYGDIRNLSFMLPTAPSYQYYWPLRFHISHARTDLLNKEKPNMAINIGRFSSRQILPIMPNDTVVMTILRDPVYHFESVYEYADISKLTGLWNSSRDPFGEFLEAEKNYSLRPFAQNSSSFALEMNLLKNGMAFDLGFEHQSFSDVGQINEFIQKIHSKLDFVLIADYFDESLILMKRMLCWDTEDIIYVKHKVRNSIYKNRITYKQKDKIRDQNKADVTMYQHFNKSLWEKIDEQGDGFWDEVREFQAKVKQIKDVCFEENTYTKTFELPLILRRNVPSELKEICNKLRLKDKEYIKILKEKQSRRISDANLKLINDRFYRDFNDSRILFEYEKQIITTNSSMNATNDFK